MMKILMVCMGNLCRSPMARAVAQQMAHRQGRSAAFAFDSAGTHAPWPGAPTDTRVNSVLAANGYAVCKDRSRRVVAQDFDHFDLILAMDRDNLTQLTRACPPSKVNKLKLLMSFAPELGIEDIPDPYYGNRAGFERVFELCEAGVGGLIIAHTQRPLR